ncbi:MAG: 2-oxo acid dehydrogenase subunit E2, partial [Moraxellaceae bacterium]
MTAFTLPDLGEGLADATVLAWHVAPGARVRRGEVLLEVETAKAVVEIPAPYDGDVQALLANVGDTVPVGSALLTFADAATDAPAQSDPGSVVGHLPGAARRRDEPFLVGRHRHTEARLQQAPARRRARTASAERRTPTPADAGNDGTPLSPLRARMARQLDACRAVIPVTLFDEAVLRLDDLHTLTARLVRALVAGAAAAPALNAHFNGSTLVATPQPAVHVGRAIDTPAGLVVPVLRHAERLGLRRLQRHIDCLKAAAHSARLTPEDMAGATLTLSNFGAIAGRFATPLVQPPQVAILGAGRAYAGLRMGRRKPKPCLRLPLSLSVDHRAVTGGEAARFLAAVI